MHKQPVLLIVALLALGHLATVSRGVAAAPTSSYAPSVADNLARLKAIQQGCTPQCPGIKYKQRTAASLAISMVMYANCEGNVQSAAKAIVAAAAHGQQDAFSAGFAMGASRLAVAPEQLVDTLTQTFTIAASSKKPGSQLTDLLTKIVVAINSMATKVKCSVASKMAEDFFQSLKKFNHPASNTFISIVKATGSACWSRRLQRVATSEIAKLPIAVSPCTRAMQEASAVSVSMITASTCRSTPDELQATAYAMVTAAVQDGCSFASAVTAASIWGVPCDSLVKVFTLAITKAKVAKKYADVAAAFASAYAEVVYIGEDGNPQTASEDSDAYLRAVLKATAAAIDVSGCAQTATFVKGLYANMISTSPTRCPVIRAAFLRIPSIRNCKCLPVTPCPSY